MSTAKTRSAGAKKKATAKKSTVTAAKAKKAAAKPAGAKATPAKPAAVKSATVKKKAAARTRGARKTGRGTAAASAPLLAEVEALAELMERHGLLEVSYAVEADGTKELHVSRTGSGAGAVQVVAASAPQHTPLAAPAPAATSAAPAALSAPAAPVAEAGLHAFTSPMVGTFYRAASPEASAFVSVGDSVDTSSVVCIIEAMKVMNEINPDIAGEVVSIEVENGEAVEYGQTLMLLRPR